MRYVLYNGWLLLPEPALYCFFPYIFVDNPWSIIAGREVIGFPKMLADFGPAPFAIPASAKTLAITVPGTGSQLHSAEFLTITNAGSTSTSTKTHTWTLTPADLARIDPALNFINSITPQGEFLRTAHLKQFRDGASSDNACYQAIIEGNFTMTNFRAKIAHAVIIEINAFHTLKIDENLGLLGSSSNIVPLSQFSATIDLKYENATTVFQNV